MAGDVEMAGEPAACLPPISHRQPRCRRPRLVPVPLPLSLTLSLTGPRLQVRRLQAAARHLEPAVVAPGVRVRVMGEG